MNVAERVRYGHETAFDYDDINQYREQYKLTLARAVDARTLSSDQANLQMSETNLKLASMAIDRENAANISDAAQAQTTAQVQDENLQLIQNGIRMMTQPPQSYVQPSPLLPQPIFCNTYDQTTTCQ